MIDFQITNLEIYPPQSVTGRGKKEIVYPTTPILVATPYRPPSNTNFGNPAYVPPEIVFGPVFMEPSRAIMMLENLTRMIHNHTLYELLFLREKKGTNFYTIGAVTDREYTSARFLSFVKDGKTFVFDGKAMGITS